ncbi:MAG TPA: TetR family transcriptional regulator [Microbacterium sp.]|uniref:TetR/AcrR family transcriptional regulator n=1 Tax=Microbacterium sp. TaxID=51671 RepID=UPI002CEBF950|nr:TetR family transcriptional regulator [Microbacterium sp.]HWI30274.1 TetR family transcriptional regulator [Microbacterium sp.]
MSTRERALIAAVSLVGEQGVRALTHTRVDAAAGLPKGSTSNWFRTRDALVTGVIDWIAELERVDLEAAMAPAETMDDVVDALCRLLESATGEHAVRTRARYALFLEASAAPSPLPALREGRSRFELWIRDLLARLGAPEPDTAARALLAVSAGLIVNRLTVAPGAPIRPTVELVARGSLSA